MLKTKNLQYTLIGTLLITLLCLADSAYTMDNGDEEWSAYCKSTNKKERKRLLLRGTMKGHPECERETARTTKSETIRRVYQKRFEENPRNPNRVVPQTQQQKQEQPQKKPQQQQAQSQSTEQMQLQLQLEQAKIRQMELELQLAKAKNPTQAHYQPQQRYVQQQGTNNVERNIRIADGMVNLANDGLNLYNNLQGGGFF